jgi:hypothetical protein
MVDDNPAGEGLDLVAYAEPLLDLLLACMKR